MTRNALPVSALCCSVAVNVFSDSQNVMIFWSKTYGFKGEKHRFCLLIA